MAAARVCVLSMSELEMVDAAVGMGCELTIISLTIKWFLSSCHVCLVADKM